MITSRAAGVSEIMKPGIHGEVVSDPSDITALTEAIRGWLSLMGDPLRAAAARAACASLAAEYSLERNLRETLAVIRGVISEKSGDPR